MAAIALLGLSSIAHGATVYQLQSMTFNTSSVPGTTYTFGVGILASSVCYTCGSSLATDDGIGNITVDSLSYKMVFGANANFTNTFSGTTVLGALTTLIKDAGETCVIHAGNAANCDLADRRGWNGDRYNGLMGDGVTAAPARQFSALVTGNDLALRVRTHRDAPGGSSETAWTQITFNYSVVPVPAAVWLFGSALGLLGVARRRAASV